MWLSSLDRLTQCLYLVGLSTPFLARPSIFTWEDISDGKKIHRLRTGLPKLGAQKNPPADNGEIRTGNLPENSVRKKKKKVCPLAVGQYFFGAVVSCLLIWGRRGGRLAVGRPTQSNPRRGRWETRKEVNLLDVDRRWSGQCCTDRALVQSPDNKWLLYFFSPFENRRKKRAALNVPVSNSFHPNSSTPLLYYHFVVSPSVIVCRQVGHWTISREKGISLEFFIFLLEKKRTNFLFFGFSYWFFFFLTLFVRLLLPTFLFMTYIRVPFAHLRPPGPSPAHSYFGAPSAVFWN